MFASRRRRAASNPQRPLNGPSVNSHATTAAASAFLKDRASSTSLSAAAAATALRARPTTPTSVADVQTKRTIRRAGSTSSAGSSTAGAGGRGRGPGGAPLQRTNSSGSMTERTFRSPSPSSRGQPSTRDAPPVPAIPADMQQPPLLLKSPRRASSVEAQRIASPPPQVSHGRGSSLGPATQTLPQMSRRGQISSSVHESTGSERPPSRGSVNFSLPTHSRPTSPQEQRQLTPSIAQRTQPARFTTADNRRMVYDPNTRSFLPEIEVLNIKQRVQDAATQPVKKSKRIAPNQAEGTHLDDGTVGGRIQGTAVNPQDRKYNRPAEDAQTSISTSSPADPEPVSRPSATPAPVTNAQGAPTEKKKKKTRLVPQQSGLGVMIVSDSESDQPHGLSSDNDSDAPSRTAIKHGYGGTKLSKKPSVVREDREREEEEDDTTPKRAQLNAEPPSRSHPANTRTITSSGLPVSHASRGHGKSLPVAAILTPHPETESHPAAAQPVGQTSEIPDRSGGASEDVIVASAISNGMKNDRAHSTSPARTTHFAAHPDNLSVMHQPPARSVSPRKSALKQSNSPRGSSPAPGINTDDQTRPLSMISNDVSVTNEDPVKARKKAVRVSFDDSNVAVIEPSPPPADTLAGNQTKRPWFSLGRGKKKDASALDTEDDEVMKPRPALPSFGSVRERKKRETTERQLVKPADPSQPKAVVIPPTPSTFVPPEPVLGQSTDHVVGAIFAQDAAAKHEANISKSREPLPPQVTSVEGSGYHSDSDSSEDGAIEQSESRSVPTERTEHLPDERRAEAYTALTGEPTALHEAQESKTAPVVPEPKPATRSGEYPKINIVQASPISESSAWRTMSPIPGSWDNSAWESGDSQNEDDAPTPKASPRIAAQHPVDETPALAGITEPTSETHKPVVLKNSTEDFHPTPISAQIAEESDTSSIYSDAAEDLSDLEEGDGFLSLDAVVESPITSAPQASLALRSPPESPTAKLSRDHALQHSRIKTKRDEPTLDEGWGKAQEYWKGLTADKRRQLEQEARDSSDGSDTETEAYPMRKMGETEKVAASFVPFEVTRQRQSVPQHQRAYQITPGTKAGPNGHTPVIRSSMRDVRDEPIAAAPGPEGHIRKSMRGSDSMRSSLRGSSDTVQVKGSLQKKYRPMSLPIKDIKSDPAAVRQHIRALSAASAAVTSQTATKNNAPPLLRRQSSADSASSFKRSRPTGDGFSLRRSMRGSDPSPDGRQTSPRRGGGFTLRTHQPTTTSSHQPFGRDSNAVPHHSSTQASTHMRTSMRSHYGDSGPTLRAQAPSKRGKSPLRLPGFGRSSSAKPAKSKAIPQRSSRFADSSDEEDKQPTFRSRFVDSSDDDGDASLPRSTVLPRTMRGSQPPARSTPQRSRIEEIDSSDLSVSEEEKSPRLAGKSFSGLGKLNKPRLINGISSTTKGKSTTTPTKQGLALSSGSLRRAGSGRGTLASPPTLPQGHTTTTISAPPLSTSRPGHSRRGSSFLSILRRKKPDPNPNTKVRKSDAESPARRDTPLERSQSELKAVKGGEQADGEGRRLPLGGRSWSTGSWKRSETVGAGLNGERPKSPRLQKRAPLSREGSGVWPLSVPVNGTTVSAPAPAPATMTAATGSRDPGSDEKATEADVIKGGRFINADDTQDKEDGDHRDANGSLNLSVDDDNDAIAGEGTTAPTGTAKTKEKTKKKKKFGKLRRMLRLDD